MGSARLTGSNHDHIPIGLGSLSSSVRMPIMTSTHVSTQTGWLANWLAISTGTDQSCLLSVTALGVCAVLCVCFARLACL